MIVKSKNYHIKIFINFGASAIILTTLQNCSQNTSKTGNSHPNVILILADDMAFGDLAFINGNINHTPVLDQLAKEGIWFNQAYSASPVSAPARAALLTGKYPHQTGCVTLNIKRFPELTRMDTSLITLADAFNNNGYITGLIGKWHCGEGEGYHPLDRGFEEFEGFIEGNVKSYFTYELEINGAIKKFTNQYLTYELSKRAIEFVRRHKNDQFFLHIAHYAPHRPIEAPVDVIDHYLKMGYKESQSTIYAMIEIMDQGIGQLIAELDRLGIREKTLIIFTSDNGPDPIPGLRNNQGLRGTKYMVNEGGIRVPFILNWKNKLESRYISDVIHFTDIFPTLVNLCGLQLSVPIDFEGSSMAELFMGKYQNNLPEARYWQWNRGVPIYSQNAAMRRGKWKLVRPFVTREVSDEEFFNKPVLYDLENDPFEENDVSKQNQQVYETMNVLLEQWSREMEFARLQIKN